MTTEKLQPSRADIYGEGRATAALGSMGGEPVAADDEPCPNCRQPVAPLYRHQVIRRDVIVFGLCRACFEAEVVGGE